MTGFHVTFFSQGQTVTLELSHTEQQLFISALEAETVAEQFPCTTCKETNGCCVHERDFPGEHCGQPQAYSEGWPILQQRIKEALQHGCGLYMRLQTRI